MCQVDYDVSNCNICKKYVDLRGIFLLRICFVTSDSSDHGIGLQTLKEHTQKLFPPAILIMGRML